MIETVADLLAGLIQQEKMNFEEFSFITHPVIRGNMYEELMQKLLRKSVFKGLDLRVVGGFIRSSARKLSDEIDCMLVCGPGQAIPGNHNKFVYNLDQVIAVIQVKKTLFSELLRKSVYNVNSIFDLTESYDVSTRHYSMANDMFKVIARQEILSQQDYEDLSPARKSLYNSFLADSAFPLRLIWGFNGFASLSNFRDAVLSFLEEQIALDNNRIIHGPEYLPNLIICGSFAIAKTNAMPYGQQLDGSSSYLVYASTSSTPLIAFLEVLWTRLTYLFPQLPISIFGEDLDNEAMLPLVTCSYVQKDGTTSCYYNFLSVDSDGSEDQNDTQWKPVALSRLQAQVMMRLCNGQPMNYESDEALKKYIESEGHIVEQFVETLIQTGLVYRRNGSLHLLTEQCGVVVFGGQWYAGENKSGRLERWLMKNSQESEKAS